MLHNLHPHPCMTISRGDVEVNVHWVSEGETGFGYYKPGQVEPLKLERRPIQDFITQAEKALDDGCAISTRLMLGRVEDYL